MTRTVLLLDDDAQFRALMVPALESRGLRVLEASKGRVARELLAHRQPDLVIVDGLLPDTNGVAWIEEARGAGFETPMLFVSAFFKDLSSYRKLTGELGVARVMHKPVQPESLAAEAASLMHLDEDAAPCGAFASGVEVVPEELLIFPMSRDFELAEDELHVDYQARIPETLDEIVRLASAAKEGAGELEDASRLAHQVHGTSGSFGFAEVSDMVGRLEQALRSIQQGAASNFVAVDRLLVEIRDEVGRRRSPSGSPASDASSPLTAEELREEDEPLYDARKSDVPTTPLPARPLESQWPQLIGPGVLVVDADPALLGYFRAALGDRMVRLVTATTLEEAVQEARLAPPDLALLGLPFGEPDRLLELAAALRAQPGCEDLPLGVIAMHDEIEARRHAAAADADIFLAHPLDGRALDRAIARLRDARSGDSIRVSILSIGGREAAGLIPPLVDAGFEVEAYGALPSLLAGTHDQAPHAIVIDAGVGGRSLCRLIRESSLGYDVAVLLVGEEDREAALAAGADDVLLDPKTWAMTLTARARRVQCASAHLPFCPITNLPRRDVLAESLISRLAAAQRHARPFCLALVQVDSRDAIAREYGRASAERVVAELGRLLFARFRLEDVRGRWGENAFLLGFDDVQAEVMAPVLRRVQEEFAALVMKGGGDRNFEASFSVGLATGVGPRTSLKRLIVDAEETLEEALSEGEGGLRWAGDGAGSKRSAQRPGVLDPR